MVLSLLSDRSTERERQGGRGRGSPRGSCTRKRGVLLKNTKFLGPDSPGGSECLGFEGDGHQLQDSVFRFKPHQNPANLIHQTPRRKRCRDF